LLQRETKRDRAALDTTVEGNPSQPKTKPTQKKTTQICAKLQSLRSKNQNPQGEFGNDPIFTNPKKNERGSN
jgi:hypothetical protein